MAIVDEDIQRVREATDTVAVIGAHVGLRRVGRRQMGLCPFHNEKSPSFSVNAEEGLYYCFGCNASGDIISFVQQIEGLDFRSAVELLAERAGISLRYTEEGTADRRRRSSELHEVLGEAVDYFHDRLLTGDDAGPARSYLRSRGYDGDVVRRFRIGWAPDGWDELTRALRRSEKLLVDAGLAFENRRGRLQDSFRARVMFPIFDVAGRPVGFGGRIMPGAEGPKYKNSAQGPVYDKSRVLYGLNWAKQQAVANGRVVVCEGYTDVIGFATAGVTEAVATCGTSLTEDHVKVMRRFARRLVLAFDADAAGQGAAERVYAWERAHDLEVAVVDLGAGRDPGDVAFEDPAALVAAVDEAQPFLGWRVDRILNAASFDTPEHRARAARAALEAISEHPDGFVRDQYVMSVADRCGLDPDQLRVEVSPRGRRVAVASPVEQPVGVLPEIDRTELEALRLLVHRREAIADRLHARLFASPAGAAAYEALAAHGTVRAAVEASRPELHVVLHKIAVEESEAEVDDVMRLLAQHAGRQMLDDLTRRYSSSAALSEHYPLLEWLRLRLDELTDEEHCGPAIDALSAWLRSLDDEDAA
ncbi:MAG: DNA primase [Actinomycetota bacterium]